MIEETEALRYHNQPRPGKIEVVPTKPCLSQSDLSLDYTPGVAAPCLQIYKNPELSFDYTSRGNLVGVVSNGSAVLGLGNIGALAGKPVMEGKAILFKRFADLDVFDIELNTQGPDEFIRTVKLLEPTFGGINLDDINIVVENGRVSVSGKVSNWEAYDTVLDAINYTHGVKDIDNNLNVENIEKLVEIYEKFYRDESFVRVVDVPYVKNVVNTNYCDIGVDFDLHSGRILVMSAIDNLIKGASGQAVQNMNLMCGFGEREGLGVVGGHP